MLESDQHFSQEYYEQDPQHRQDHSSVYWHQEQTMVHSSGMNNISDLCHSSPQTPASINPMNLPSGPFSSNSVPASPSMFAIDASDESIDNKGNKQPDVYTQNLYKTELCKTFTESGYCRYGAKCRFAHGVGDLRPLQRHKKYKTEKCKNYVRDGYCPYASRCRFVHGEDEILLNPLNFSSLINLSASLASLSGSPSIASSNSSHSSPAISSLSIEPDSIDRSNTSTPLSCSNSSRSSFSGMNVDHDHTNAPVPSFSEIKSEVSSNHMNSATVLSTLIQSSSASSASSQSSSSTLSASVDTSVSGCSSINHVSSPKLVQSSPPSGSSLSPLVSSVSSGSPTHQLVPVDVSPPSLVTQPPSDCCSGFECTGSFHDSASVDRPVAHRQDLATSLPSSPGHAAHYSPSLSCPPSLSSPCIVSSSCAYTDQADSCVSHVNELINIPPHTITLRKDDPSWVWSSPNNHTNSNGAGNGHVVTSLDHDVSDLTANFDKFNPMRSNNTIMTASGTVPVLELNMAPPLPPQHPSHFSLASTVPSAHYHMYPQASSNCTIVPTNVSSNTSIVTNIASTTQSISSIAPDSSYMENVSSRSRRPSLQEISTAPFANQNHHHSLGQTSANDIQSHSLSHHQTNFNLNPTIRSPPCFGSSASTSRGTSVSSSPALLSLSSVSSKYPSSGLAESHTFVTSTSPLGLPSSTADANHKIPSTPLRRAPVSPIISPCFQPSPWSVNFDLASTTAGSSLSAAPSTSSTPIMVSQRPFARSLVSNSLPTSPFSTGYLQGSLPAHLDSNGAFALAPPLSSPASPASPSHRSLAFETDLGSSIYSARPFQSAVFSASLNADDLHQSSSDNSTSDVSNISHILSANHYLESKSLAISVDDNRPANFDSSVDTDSQSEFFNASYHSFNPSTRSVEPSVHGQAEVDDNVITTSDQSITPTDWSRREHRLPIFACLEQPHSTNVAS